MRKMRKQPVGPRNDWNFDLEAGDRVYIWTTVGEKAMMDDLVLSTGKDKRAVGELTPRRVSRNGWPRIAVVKDGVWYWEN